MPQVIPAEPVREHCLALMRQGLSLQTIGAQVGLPQSRITRLVYAYKSRYTGERYHQLWIKRATGEAIMRIEFGEDLWPNAHQIDGSLTRQRLLSLRTMGHGTNWMREHLGSACLNNLVAGKRNYVTVGKARLVRDLYQRFADVPGDSIRSAGRARAKGHLLPNYWDDPGTLVWPEGITGPDPLPEVLVDHVVVERLVVGMIVPMTTEERNEAIMVMYARGMSSGEIGGRLGLDEKVARSVRDSTRRRQLAQTG